MPTKWTRLGDTNSNSFDKMRKREIFNSTMKINRMKPNKPKKSFKTKQDTEED